MLKKSEVVGFCKSLSEDYHGWDFLSGAFKNKERKYVTQLVDPLWSFSPGSALMSPIAGIYHVEIEKIFKKIFGFSSYWTHRVRHNDHYSGYEGGGVRIYDLGNDNKQLIMRMLDQGIELIEKTYDFSSERALLESIPEDIEEADGVKYCLVRAFLGDYEYVVRYRRDEIKTVRPKDYDWIDKIMAHYEIAL